jgi:hypothetical protein
MYACRRERQERRVRREETKGIPGSMTGDDDDDDDDDDDVQVGAHA